MEMQEGRPIFALPMIRRKCIITKIGKKRAVTLAKWGRGKE